MTGFGGYEGVREIHRSGGKSVWTARRAGGTGESFAIRWLEPFTTHWDDEEARREIALFLERAEIQRKAATGGKFWAPIFAHGEIDGRAALVTRNYRRTAEELIQGKVSIGAAGLHRIVRAVVRGLQQLQRTCARPHGALRASSILIGGKRKLSQATIVLCSPAPAAAVEGRDEKVDFVPLGQLIYQLVTHHPFKRVKIPLEAGEEWLRLGRKGEAWRALCNDLLDPAAPTSPRDLKELRRRVRKLAPAPVRMRTLIVSAVLGVVVVAVALFVYRISLDPRGDWERLCYEYGTWARDFVADVEANQLDAGGDAELAANTARAKRMAENASAFDPRMILPNSEGRSYAQLVEEWEQLREDSTAYAHAAESASVVKTLRSDLTRWLDRSLRPVRELAEAIRRDANGATDVSRELDALTVRLPADLKDMREQRKATAADILRSSDLERVESLARQINELKQATPIVNDVLQRWPKVNELAERISGDEQGKNDAVLVKFRDFSRRSTAQAPSLAEMQRALTQVQSLGDRVAAAMAGRWRKEGAPLTRTAPPKLDAQMFEGWLGAIETNLPGDQFAQWSQANLKRISEGRDYVAKLKDQPDYAADAKKVDAGYEAVVADFKELSGRTWSTVSKDSVDAKLAELSKQLNEVNESLKGMRTRRTEQDVLTQNAVAGVDSDALNARWRELKADAGRAGAVEALQKVLRDMDASAPAELAVPASPSKWPGGLQDAYAKQREKLLEDAAPRVRLAMLSSPQGEVDRVAGPMKALHKHAEELRSQCTSLETMLKLLLAGDEAPAAGAPTLAATVKAIQAHGADAQGRTLMGAVGELLKRGTAVTEIDNSDRAKLAAKAKGRESPDALWAIWKWLRAHPDWPKDAAELDDEIALRNTLSAAVADMKKDKQTSGRATAIAQQLDGQTLATAQTCIRASAALGEDQVRQVEARLKDLGIDPLRLPDEPRFTIMFARLSGKLGAQRVTDDQAIASLTEFRKDMGKADDPAVARRLAEMEQSIAAILASHEQDKRAPVKEVTGFETLRPAWTKTQVDDGFVFTSPYGPPYQMNLEFIRVTPGGRAATFICTTEVTLGLFDVIVQQRKLWKEAPFASGLGAVDPVDGDSRTAPYVWIFDNQSGRIVPAPRWLDLAPVHRGKPWNFSTPYPDDKLPPPPTYAHPMQHIAPRQAEAFAVLLGCRLPQEAEWRMAYRVQAAAGRNGDRENVRDATWSNIYKKLKGGETAEWLLAGYDPRGDPAGAREGDNEPWFAAQPLREDGRFHDMVGNVGEWVKTAADGFGVVGGSAFTDRPSQPDVALPVEPSQYSDVGFRLALDAAVHSLAKSLREKLAPLGGAAVAAGQRAPRPENR